MKSIVRNAVIAAAFLTFITGAPLYARTNGTNHETLSKIDSVKESYRAKQRKDSLNGGAKASNSASDLMKKVAANEVNMVTNTHEGKAQNEIVINGKRYFATGDGYAFTISQNRSICFAADPVTNKKVNKADAVTYADASGRVFYFESEDTYKEFIKLASSKQ